jgi:hypothetical protein
LRKSLFQAGEIWNHAVKPGDREDAEDSIATDDQQYLAVLGAGPLVRTDQCVKPGRVAKLRTAHVDHEGPVPRALLLAESAVRSSAALVISMSSGAATTGTLLITSAGKPASGICINLRYWLASDHQQGDVVADWPAADQRLHHRGARSLRGLRRYRLRAGRDRYQSTRPGARSGRRCGSKQGRR